MAQRRIETSTSRTAEMTCVCRAASFLETDPRYKSGDSTAGRLLPRMLQLAFHSRVLRKLLLRLLMPAGIYEWVIARTKYIDALVTRCQADGFKQVLLIGAGFDTRAIRFQPELKAMKVYELDAPTTQRAKVEQYRRRRIAVPANLIFVPVNFETEKLEDRLREAGFGEGHKTLVIAEGVMQYLTPEAAHATLQTVHKMVGRGSRLVFDFAHAEVLEGTGTTFGQVAITRSVGKFGESWQFGLQEGELETLLARHGYKLVERKTPHDLEDTYFKDSTGKLVGRVNGTQSIALAEKEV